MITDEERDKMRVWFDLAIEAPILATKVAARVEMRTLGEMGTKLIAENAKLREDFDALVKVGNRAIEVQDIEIAALREIVREVAETSVYGICPRCQHTVDRHTADCFFTKARALLAKE